MHRNSQRLFEKYGLPHIQPEHRVLEVGPDSAPSTYQRLSGTTSGWDTLDLASRTDVSLTYRTEDEYHFPVGDAGYDVILAGQVIEHVRKIWRWMPELARLCRPGGVVIVINPISWHYHESPVDCWRIYPEGMRALCQDSGLDVLLSTWESVELEPLGRITPARLRKHRIMQRLSGLVGLLNAGVHLPIEAAYDTITVARRPLQLPDPVLAPSSGAPPSA